MSTHSVLLVEDDAAVRHRLARAVDNHPHLVVQAAVGTCAEARACVLAQPPAVLLTDLGLPDGSGIDLIRQVHRDFPDIAILVITVFGDEAHVIGALEAGASGYLLKDGHADYIGQSILQLVNGGSPISAAIARHLLKRFQVTAVQPTATEVMEPESAEITPQLTDREREILQLVAKGFTFREIAATLTISAHTVAAHIKQIYRKLAVHSRSEAVYEAVNLGLLNFDDLALHRDGG